MSQKITIEPVTRVEGHGKVTIQMDDDLNVIQSRLHIVEFRGFERFVQGRPYWEAPVLVQRLCGICPVSHHLAAAKALDVIVGAGVGDGLTPTADKIRRLMHYGQMFQSHALHFFHLAAPDFLLGIDSDPSLRNVIGIIAKFPELATQAVKMRKFGQEIIAVTAGKKIHGRGAIPGGVNKSLSTVERDKFLKGEENIDVMIEWSQAAIALFKDYHKAHVDFIDGFSIFPSNYMSLVGKDGAMDLYHGVMRVVDQEGRIILNDVSYQDYTKYIAEDVRTWSYMKFPFLKKMGKESGWYTVGPLARLNVCNSIPTPLAQKEFEIYKAYSNGKPHHNSLHMHWARLIELLHSAEMIKDLLNDPDIMGCNLLTLGVKQFEGVGVIEAPRGTLIHHYKINENDQILMANLIVSTTNNNESMNRAVNYVSKKMMTGHREITEGMKNAVEVAIRAYDPCLSCATHSLGKMPLEISLYDSENELLDQYRS